MAHQQARLIPVSGISNANEAEQRATSALLAVLQVVRPFSKAILSPLGASRAATAVVDCYVEPSFKLSNGKTARPDGLISVSYGKQDPWVALVEVKTGTAKLNAEQLNQYVEIAKTNRFDCVVTISNEIAPSPGVHPTKGLKVRSNSKVSVHHLSWTKLLAEAVMEKTHRGVSDPEQAWILGELIRYLEHPNSGAMGFDDMGENWVDVRDNARNGSLNRRDEAVADIAQRWDQLLSFASLKLGADIGEDVLEVVPRAQQTDPKLRTRAFVDSLCSDGKLAGVLRVPNTVGDIEVLVDLKARQNVVSVTLDAPKDKGGKGRIGWLIRQLRDAPEALVIEAYAKNSRNGMAATLGAVREDASLLLGPAKKEPVKFALVARSELGVNRRAGKKPGFVQSVIAATESFYGDILQHLTAYQTAAPKMQPRPEVIAEPAAEELPSVPLVDVREVVLTEEPATAEPTPAPIASWMVNR